MTQLLLLPIQITTALVTVLVFVTVSTGQETNDKQPVATSQTAPAEKNTPPAGDLLAGPKVDSAQAGGGTGFGGLKRTDQQPAIPWRPWLRAVHELVTEREQRQQIVAVSDDYAKAMETFRRDHREQFRALRQRQQQLDRTDRKAVRNLRLQRRELMEQRPDIAPFQQRIWDLLAEDQQGWLSNKLQRMRNEQAQRRPGQRGTDGAARQRRGDADARPPTPSGKAEQSDTQSTRPDETVSRSARRVRFLEANRSRQHRAQPRAQPTNNEKTFEFEDKKVDTNEN